MHTRYLMLACLGLVLAACAREDETRSLTAEEAADGMSQLAVTPEQAELWKAAPESSAAALENISVATQAVESRAHPEDANRPVGGGQFALAAGQPNAVRIISAPEIAKGAYLGPARITAVEGDRVDFDLGEKRQLSVLLRLQSAPLRAKSGDQAQIEFRRRDDPRDRAELFALKAPGQGIVTVLEGATKPVTVSVALYKLTAAQTGEALHGTMPVLVTVGGEQMTLRQGETADFKRAGLTVGIVASLAVSGEDVNREEGNPYAIRLLAWSSGNTADGK